MERIRIKMLLALSLICLSASAQTEYSGIAGASPRLVKANKQARAKAAQHSSRRTASPAVSSSRSDYARSSNTRDEAYPQQYEGRDSAETEVKQGFKTFSRGMGKVIKRKTKTMGEVTRKIGDEGKKFFKKFGKSISDSFKPDTANTK